MEDTKYENINGGFYYKFTNNSPSGAYAICNKELKIIFSKTYIANNSFFNEEDYIKFISNLKNQMDKTKILIECVDTSFYGNKRVYAIMDDKQNFSYN
jgi:hypothetical protein